MEAMAARETKESLLIHPEDIDPERRPKLAEMLSIVDGFAYLLSTESLSADPDDNRLVIFIMSPGTCGLIEDSPAHPESGGEEYYHATLLDDISIISLRSLIAPPPKVRKESTGRPPKYSMEQEGTDIFIQYVYEGQSIKSIAQEHKMSPTTVQKLLNQSRLRAADNFVSGVWHMSPESVNWSKNLQIMQWAIKHSTGEKQQAYQDFLEKVQETQETPDL